MGYGEEVLFFRYQRIVWDNAIEKGMGGSR